MTGQELAQSLRSDQPAVAGRTSPRAVPVHGIEGTVTVVGLGYIGLATAAMLADRHFAVTGYDVKPHVVEGIKSGRPLIDDPGLHDLVRRGVASGRLKAFLKPQPASTYIIAVPTPIRDSADHAPDLSYVFAAAEAIAPVLQRGNLVVLESTSPVGTTREVARCIRKLRPDLSSSLDTDGDPNIFFAYCPERIIPGKMLEELTLNDRIIGGIDSQSAHKARQIYFRLGKGECHVTDDRTAEMVKLTENAFRDVNIAFSNELSKLARAADLDVFKIIELANRHPRVNILRPGPGVGGHCIAVDPWFIVAADPHNSPLIATARAVNDSKPALVVADVLAAAGQSQGDVLLLGLTYKENVGDFRESPALKIARELTTKLGARVSCVDGFAADSLETLRETRGLNLVTLEQGLSDATVIVLLVGHTEFLNIRPKADQTVIDVVGLLPR